MIFETMRCRAENTTTLHTIMFLWGSPNRKGINKKMKKILCSVRNMHSIENTHTHTQFIIIEN